MKPHPHPNLTNAGTHFCPLLAEVDFCRLRGRILIPRAPVANKKGRESCSLPTLEPVCDCKFYLKDFTAAASSSFTSKTVYSFVICSRSFTFFVRFSSFSSPPWFFVVVNALTNSPMPELSM